MRIALRTSGGRGEYELAGKHGGVGYAEIEGKAIHFQISPNIAIDGKCFVNTSQGKPRIRLKGGEDGIHLYRALAAILLMPPPKRELAKTSTGIPFLSNESYSITSIPAQIVKLRNDSVTLSITGLQIGNASHKSAWIDLPSRLSVVFAIWAQLDSHSNEFSEPFRIHRDAVLLGNLKGIERATKRLYGLLGAKKDSLDSFARMFGVMANIPVPVVSENCTGDDVDDLDTTSFQFARVRQLKAWKRQATRGHAGTLFRQRVKQAYDFTCAFTGLRLPRLPVCDSAGVDAAHILPWANYDMEHVSNGICLSKDCHWAFDRGILRLDYELTSDLYRISVPHFVFEEASKFNFSIERFTALQGADLKLPADPKLRPSVQNLSILNSLLFGDS